MLIHSPSLNSAESNYHRFLPRSDTGLSAGEQTCGCSVEAAPHSAFVLQSGLAGCVVPDSALSPHFPVFLRLIVSAGSMFDDSDHVGRHAAENNRCSCSSPCCLMWFWKPGLLVLQIQDTHSSYITSPRSTKPLIVYSMCIYSFNI